MKPSMDHVLDAALRLLSHRPRSEAEVRRQLSRRFSLSVVEEAIAVLRGRGLVDDVAFARFWRQSRERHRPRGASAIRWELLRLGVSGEVVEEALEGLDEQENAYRAASGTLRRLRTADYATFRRKLGGYLARRGFRGEIVKGPVERLWSELSDAVNSDVEGNAQGDKPEDIT